MEQLTLAALAALVIKIVSVLKAIGKDNNTVVTQVLVWVVGIGVLVLAAHSSLTADLVLAGRPIGSLDGASLVIAGLALGSTGSFAYDVKSALDGTDSAAEPPLLPVKPPAVP